MHGLELVPELLALLPVAGALQHGRDFPVVAHEPELADVRLALLERARVLVRDPDRRPALHEALHLGLAVRFLDALHVVLVLRRPQPLDHLRPIQTGPPLARRRGLVLDVIRLVDGLEHGQALHALGRLAVHVVGHPLLLRWVLFFGRQRARRPRVRCGQKALLLTAVCGRAVASTL